MDKEVLSKDQNNKNVLAIDLLIDYLKQGNLSKCVHCYKFMMGFIKFKKNMNLKITVYQILLSQKNIPSLK